MKSLTSETDVITEKVYCAQILTMVEHLLDVLPFAGLKRFSKTDATGKASNVALDLSTQLGISSGPDDFILETDDNLWYTSFSLIVNLEEILL